MDILFSSKSLIPAVISLVSVLTVTASATATLANQKNWAKFKSYVNYFRTLIEDVILFGGTFIFFSLWGIPYGIFCIWRLILLCYLRLNYGPLGDLVKKTDIVSIVDSDKSRQIIKSLKVMEGECDLEDLRMRCQLAVGRTGPDGFLVYPKFYQRLEIIKRYYCWLPSNFDINHHVRYMDGLDENSESISEAEAFERCGRMCNEPFAEGRANWEILVIPKYHYNSDVDTSENSGELKKTAVKKMAIFIRIHHGIGDGFSLLKFILKDMAREKELDIPLPKRKKRSLLFGFGVMGYVWLRGTRQLLTQVTVRDVNALYNNQIQATGEKCLAWSEQISLDFIKQVKTELKTSISAVMLTAFAGALRQYYKEIDNGKHPEQVTLIMPLPAPNHPDDMMVNKFSVSIFKLSTDSADPVERLKAIDREGRKLAESPELVMNLLLTNTVGNMPIPLPKIFLNSNATVLVSNVPGPSRTIKIFNRKLLDTMFWLPTVGNSGLSISFLSYGKNFRIGLTVDTGIIPTGNEGANKILDNTVQELIKLARQIGVSVEGAVQVPQVLNSVRRHCEG